MTNPAPITIALAGNPNSGKTTIFNNMTGTRQKVGNWPGVTVEKKEGHAHFGGRDLRIIDLPGTYSLTPFSIEEIVARDFILEEYPDVVIDIIDASNLERSLYLATQLRELDCCKVLLALNMSDLAQSRGIKINAAKLSELLGLPVIATVGNKNQGIEDLLAAAVELACSGSKPPFTRRVKYSRDIEQAVADVQHLVQEQIPESFKYNYRWTAIKLLEDDPIVRQRLQTKIDSAADPVLEVAQERRRHLAGLFDEAPEIVMTDERYGFIAGIIKEVQSFSSLKRLDMSRSIDLVLTNRFLGFPIFIFFIWLMFQLTFTLGDYPMTWIDAGVGGLSDLLARLLPAGLFKDLLLDGILAGVGSVIVFLPNILILFFCIALFEDTGYMARSAFLMDRIMHLIGLHGKSFIPMLMGFGCNVPAVMAARTLESEKDRILTILITPFMSCSAKLPVYIMLTGSFFAAKAGSVIFAIYLTGIAVSIISGRIFRSTLLKGADAPFVMELPPYRVPMLKSLIIHMWDRAKVFLKKMTGVILIGSVVIWGLSAFPRHIAYDRDYQAEIQSVVTAYEIALQNTTGQTHQELDNAKADAIHRIERARRAEHTEKSYMGRLGKVLAPFFAPLGIDWRGGVALLSGFVAKEIVVSTLGVLYGIDSGTDTDALADILSDSGFTPLSALAMMFFVLLYLPCLATVAAIRRETGSLKWMAFSVCYSTLMAWVVAFGIYQGGRLLGFQ